MITFNLLNSGYDIPDFVDKVFNTDSLRLSGYQFPYIRLFEGEGNLELTAPLPGVSKEDIEINLADNALTIEGEKKSHTSEETFWSSFNSAA